jgi:hypothetical protein
MKDGTSVPQTIDRPRTRIWVTTEESAVVPHQPAMSIEVDGSIITLRLADAPELAANITAAVLDSTTMRDLHSEAAERGITPSELWLTKYAHLFEGADQ